jgi:glycosyltransferase involved in cell wall biosynthesis
MEVTVTLEARYAVAPDGSVWSQAGMARRFWERYLEVFDTVKIVARAVRVEEAPEGWLPVTGKNIRLHGLPDYCGPRQYVKQYAALRTAIRSAAPTGGAVILRVGSQLASMMERPLHERNRPYALEVIGDPYDTFGPGAIDHPLRRFFRWHFSRQLRRQCLQATAVAYVTRRALQERYPARVMSMGVSDVELPPEAFLHHSHGVESEPGYVPECFRQPKQHGPYQLATVGTLAQLYKGTDLLIEAVARCVRAGLDLKAVIVGDGKYRPDLMAQAERAGLATRIQFTGQVTAGEPVRRILDTADLFVLPSRQEGLPRALIEAMARGLPCIGSAVGGIPELLETSELVPVGDPAALAESIQGMLTNPVRMKNLAQRYLAVAQEFCDSVLLPRRRRFYQYVRDCTQSWELGQKA